MMSRPSTGPCKNNQLLIIWFLFDTDAAILLWKLNDSKEPEQAPMFQEDEDAQLNKESWSVFKTLRYTTPVRIDTDKLKYFKDFLVLLILRLSALKRQRTRPSHFFPFCRGTLVEMMCVCHVICPQGTHRRCVRHMLDPGRKLYGVWIC